MPGGVEEPEKFPKGRYSTIAKRHEAGERIIVSSHTSKMDANDEVILVETITVPNVESDQEGEDMANIDPDASTDEVTFGSEEEELNGEMKEQEQPEEPEELDEPEGLGEPDELEEQKNNPEEPKKKKKQEAIPMKAGNSKPEEPRKMKKAMGQLKRTVTCKGSLADNLTISLISDDGEEDNQGGAKTGTLPAACQASTSVQALTKRSGTQGRVDMPPAKRQRKLTVENYLNR